MTQASPGAEQDTHHSALHTTTAPQVNSLTGGPKNTSFVGSGWHRLSRADLQRAEKWREHTRDPPPRQGQKSQISKDFPGSRPFWPQPPMAGRSAGKSKQRIPPPRQPGPPPLFPFGPLRPVVRFRPPPLFRRGSLDPASPILFCTGATWRQCPPVSGARQ